MKKIFTISQEQLNKIEADLGDAIVNGAPKYTGSYVIIHNSSYQDIASTMTSNVRHRGALNILIHFLQIGGYDVCQVVKTKKEEPVVTGEVAL